MDDEAGVEAEGVEEAGVERALRSELARLDADLASIPRQQFAERAPMLQRRDELAADLRAAVADPETLARWAGRAGSRDTGDGTKPFIPSPWESGGV
jgi:hypothetical protein